MLFHSSYRVGERRFVNDITASAPTAPMLRKSSTGIMEKKITIDDLITHTMSLEKINDGFHLMHAGESIRNVIFY
jgi:Zn-dependent alcohol dehydrogenase